MEEKYNIGNLKISSILAACSSGEYVMPEIQRPFVWDSNRVRDLVDSLYRGYPIGFIITSQQRSVRLKNGGISAGQHLVMDGQQRLTALRTALLGEEVIDKDYSKKVIRIAFNPETEEFQVANASTDIGHGWIDDISVFFKHNKEEVIKIGQAYCLANRDVDAWKFHSICSRIDAIGNRTIGVIKLDSDLEMDVITDIFSRVNSQGVPLKTADLAMARILANEVNGGNSLGKCIFHFSELVVKPVLFDAIKNNDSEFAMSEYMRRITWLSRENDDIYDPSYEDILHVVLIYKFKRGRIKQLVQLLAGRNFETKEYEEAVIENTFELLHDGILDFINEINFKNFVMIIKSAGFCVGKMIRSTGALNFSYALYLHLKSIGMQSVSIQKFIRRWFVMSLLTGRYSGSTESKFGDDIRQIEERGIENCINEIEQSDLSDNFWENRLRIDLRTLSTSNAAFNVFLAAQCKNNCRGFLSTDYTVMNMIEERGDIHHIFPKAYLIEHNVPISMYNQVANLTYVQSEINIRIGKRSPNDYFSYVFNNQCSGSDIRYGGITSIDDLRINMEENCIPDGLQDMDVSRYSDFLEKRRALLSNAIKSYYQSL